MFPGGFGGIPDRLFPQTVPPTIPPDRPPFRKLIPIVYLEGTNKYPNRGHAVEASDCGTTAFPRFQPNLWEADPKRVRAGDGVSARRRPER